MGETTNGKIISKPKKSTTKPVYFNLDDEDELELYRKACKMNFSKWVKKQLVNQNNKVGIRNDKTITGEEKAHINREMIDTERDIQNKEIESMMI